MNPPVEEKIADLVGKWCAYVRDEHHKDRDCRFYITTEYSFGNISYRAFFQSYITQIDFDKYCPTMEQAQQELLRAIQGMLYRERRNCDRILMDHDEWDAETKASARRFFELFTEELTKETQ